MCLSICALWVSASAAAGDAELTPRAPSGSDAAQMDSPIFGQPSIRLRLGHETRVRFDQDTSRAALPSGPVRYRRFVLDKPGQDVKISVRVLAQKHDGNPRFTVFSPQLVILDADAQIRRIVTLDHLRLDIKPFRRTRLRECVVVNHLQGFLLASDPQRLGSMYQFNARPSAAGHPDHGFYRSRSPMKVFLTYADSGPVEVEITRAPKQGSACRAVPD